MAGGQLECDPTPAPTEGDDTLQSDVSIRIGYRSGEGQQVERDLIRPEIVSADVESQRLKHVDRDQPIAPP
jgi:hypothetical protein